MSDEPSLDVNDVSGDVDDGLGDVDDADDPAGPLEHASADVAPELFTAATR